MADTILDSAIREENKKNMFNCNKTTQQLAPGQDAGENGAKIMDSENKGVNLYGMDENMNKMDGLSEIQRFYHGKNVLITGATGFLGKILVEKLLRTCPGVDNLYLIVRQKKGKDIYSRMEEIFDDPIFGRLKEGVPKFRHKVVVVPGDCEAVGLGLTPSDRQMLTEKINIIFHSAATVKFNEPLRKALNINVHGPLYMLSLARDIKHLDIFGRLKEEVPKFRHKVVVIPGDCEAVGLGLTLSDRQMLTEKINIIFHSAATVKFNEPLRKALNINVHGPLYMLSLARDIKHLDVLMHVSTAYSNSHLARVEEKFYPCEASCSQLQNTIDKLSDSQIDDILPTILGPWPNTYTFTKALAEKELRINAGNSIPLGIFRPAIVTSSAKEPIPFWVDNMYGPTGVLVRSATGILRTLQCSSSAAAEIVPVDLVVAALLAAGHSVHNTYKHSPPPEPPIFNYVSAEENRMTWGEFFKENASQVDRYPFRNAVWYMSLTLHDSAIMHQLYIFFLHLIPAFLVDILAVCIGRKPKMLKLYKKIHKFTSVITYFCIKEIEFTNDNVRKLWDSTSEQDKKLFPFNIKKIDWSEYLEHHILGIRRHLLKQSDDTLPQARIQYRRLYYLHQIVRIIFLFLALYTLWSVLSLLW